MKLGAEVGYQIRFEDYTSRGTKISFVTEGILLRWFQNDPSLQGIDAVVFDEFGRVIAPGARIGTATSPSSLPA